MFGITDAPCPKCQKRISWTGRFVDMPPCPHCGHRVPMEELEAIDRDSEAIRKRMIDEKDGD